MMDDNTLANAASSCWQYAMSSGHHPTTDAFERWFKNRARTLFRLTDADVEQAWRAAIRMHS
jgi:hypothetical protein